MSYPSLAKQVVLPVGIAVVGVTALAWYVSVVASDSLMSFIMLSPGIFGPAELGLFYALMTTMMVAMMLPATLPMIMGYRQMLKSEGAAASGAPGRFGTAAFMAPYVLVWGGFGILALVALNVLALMGPMMGLAAIVPGAVLVAAGGYQVTSVKQACLRQCQSPFTFVLGRWRKGLAGALRMGLSHSKFCVGCCWMFMLALFVTGAMSLIWMGVVSVMIFVEKVGLGRAHVSRAIGVLLVLLGLALSGQALLTM